MRRAIRSRRAEISSRLRSGKAIALRDHVADNPVKITAVPFAFVVYLTLGGAYSLLSPVVVLQLSVDELLPLIIDMAPLTLKLFARLIRDSSRDLSGEILHLLAKIDKVRALL